MRRVCLVDLDCVSGLGLFFCDFCGYRYVVVG